MIRALALLGVAAILMPFVPSRAGVPGPMCQVPSVVALIEQELPTNSYYTRLDPRLISESPTPDPNLVRCYVCVTIFAYDTSRFDGVPVARCEGRLFTVRAVPHGFVVGPAY